METTRARYHRFIIRPRLSLLFVAALGCSPSSPAPTVPPRAVAAPTSAPVASATAPPPAPPKMTSASKVAELDPYVWPPPKIGDSEWTVFERPWLHTIPGAPPTFYVTSVKPDPKRKVQVQIVAIDARQIELDMAIGKEGPYPPDEKTEGKWPRTGGKLPRDPAIAKNVIAAFNGGFRLDQDAHGMTIRRRTFAPPVKGVATLLMHDDGRLGFGTFGTSTKVPEDVRSLRQNLEPLFEDGAFNPAGRKRWGGILKATNQVGQRAKRSGICRTTGGHLLYLWGDAIEAADLGAAMKQAGCEYGMHLDMNAIHIGFVFMSFDDAEYKSGKSEALSPSMGITDKRYVTQPNPKEFFYATLRKPNPVDPWWTADGYVQPPPSWMPAIWTKTEEDVRTTTFDARRVRLASTGASPFTAAQPLSSSDLDHVLAAVQLGDTEVVVGGAAGETPPDLVSAVGVTAGGELVSVDRIGPRGTPQQLVDTLIAAGCVHALRATATLERAGRDEITAEGSKLYVVAKAPPNATYRFDR